MGQRRFRGDLRNTLLLYSQASSRYGWQDVFGEKLASFLGVGIQKE